MNIELKPIAESKVRQLGGDVCGVLVRTDGKLAAVDEHGRVTWLQSGQGAEPVKYIRVCSYGSKFPCNPCCEDFGYCSTEKVAQPQPAQQGSVQEIPSNEELERLYREKHDGHIADFAADVLERWGAWQHGVLGYGGSAQLQPAVPEEMISLVAICQHLRDHLDERGTSLICHRGVTLFIDALQNAEAVTEALLSTPTTLRQQLEQAQAESVQPAQQGSVPDYVNEALQRLIENGGNLGPASREDALVVARYRRELLATPQADEWVRCDERLPTEEDWWVWIYDSEDGDIFHALWRDLKGDYENGHMNLSHWMPTGLKRPQPPKEGESDE